MKITVFGATGGTGRELVKQATAAGHTVTAVVRNPAKLPADGFEVIAAEVMDPDAITPAVTGRDLIVSALGAHPRSHEPVCSPGAESIIAAMRATGVRRLVVITAAGHVEDPGDSLLTRAVLKPILGLVLRDSFADFTRTDRIVSASGLDWTIMRPPRLTNGGRRRYRTALDRTVGTTISRADLADATLGAATDPAAIGHTVGVGY